MGMKEFLELAIAKHSPGFRRGDYGIPAACFTQCFFDEPWIKIMRPAIWNLHDMGYDCEIIIKEQP